MWQFDLFLFILIFILISEVNTYCFKYSFLFGQKFIKRRENHSLKVVKYDPNQFVTVSVRKPLGVSLFEVTENEKDGVFIGEIDEEGAIARTSKIQKGLFLLKINDEDVKKEDFDTIVNYLIQLPDEKKVQLTFIDPKSVMVGPAVITVYTPDNKEVIINTTKGQNLRKVLLGNKIEVYDMKGKFSNCGGGGICGTCVVALEKVEGWEERSDFETKKLNKYPDNCRLSCNTVIEGDCLVKIQPPRQ